MNPSSSSQLDLLEFPEEWNLQQKETSTDYLRDADNPKREQLVRVPTDGSTFIWNAPFKPLSVDIINSTGQSVNITDDTGDKIQIAGGSFVSMPVNGALHYTFQLASADNTGRACFCIFYRYRRNVAGASAAGGAASSVTIAGPLDGSGNVKTALEVALPAGANLIGSVDVANFPATQFVELVDGVGGVNKAQIDASNNLHAFISSGNVTIFGNAGAQIGQDANANLEVVQKASNNWSTAQTATSTAATSVLAARAQRRYARFRNLDSTNTIALGPLGVTIATGLLLKPGESRELDHTAQVFAIASAGTPTLEIEEVWSN